MWPRREEVKTVLTISVSILFENMKKGGYSNNINQSIH